MQDKHEKLLKELTEQNRVYEENYSSQDVDRDVLPLIVELTLLKKRLSCLENLNQFVLI